MKPTRLASMPLLPLALLLASGLVEGGCVRRPAPAPGSRPAIDPGAALVCVMRHAESYGNLDPRPQGMSPDELDRLTEAGEAQARAARAELPEPVVRVWASPKNRTRRTAELLGFDVPVEVQADLRPIEGDLPWSERRAAFARGEDPRPPGGESLADAGARIRALLDRIGGEGITVLVTHSDISALLVGELSGTPLLERLDRHPLETGQVVCRPLTHHSAASPPPKVDPA